MRTLLLLSLLTVASAANPVLKFGYGHPHACEDSSKFADTWRTCESLPSITCKGIPLNETAFMWKCDYEKISGYDSSVEVQPDQSSLRVTLTPVTDFHPFIYFMLFLFVGSLGVLVCFDSKRDVDYRDAALVYCVASSWSDGCSDYSVN